MYKAINPTAIDPKDMGFKTIFKVACWQRMCGPCVWAWHAVLVDLPGRPPDR